MEDYTSNSKNKRNAGPEVSAEAARPEVKKIVIGEVVEVKKGLGTKFKDTFLDKEFYSGLFHHLYQDSLVPNFKRIAYEVGVEALLLGIFRSGNAKQIFDPKNIVSKFSYQTPVARNGGFPPGVGMGMSSIGPSMQQPRAIELGNPVVMRQGQRRQFLTGSRQEASDVLEAMSDIINSEYKVVSLGEVREMLGLPHTPVDNAWGWFSIGDAHILQGPDGWLLDLPQPEAL